MGSTWYAPESGWVWVGLGLASIAALSLGGDVSVVTLVTVAAWLAICVARSRPPAGSDPAARRAFASRLGRVWLVFGVASLAALVLLGNGRTVTLIAAAGWLFLAAVVVTQREPRSAPA
jgi:hypothetical protein